MVVVAIIGIVAAIAGTSFVRSKARANLAATAADLQALLHQARQSALATGNPVAVLVYPRYAPSGAAGATGYFLVYQDACSDFFSGGVRCGVSYAGYDPRFPRSGGASQVLDSMTLPRGVKVGPADGMGASAQLNAPLQGVPVNVDCSFCGTTGGAVRFDARGQATFFAASGNAVTPHAASAGASLSLGYDPNVTDATGQRTLVILSASGAVDLLGGG